MNNAEHRFLSLVAVLEDWAAWQAGYNPRLGYPSHSLGISTGGASTSFDEMCESMDLEICRKVDTAIYDLDLPKRSAIFRRYLASVFQFRRLDYKTLLQQAHEELLDSLIRKHVII